MTLHHTDEHVTLYHGDCIEVMRSLPDASVDAVVTDPPYGLGFMGKEWDDAAALSSRPPSAEQHDNAYPRTGKGPAAVAFDGNGFQAWCTEWATECLRVLKPGGHLLAFGGTRTWHRLACAIEDAGFEVRDSIAWMYGSGFPKSLDVSKAIDKAAGAEREVLSSVFRGENAGKSGGIQGTTVPRTDTITAPATPAAQQWQGWGTALKPAFEPIVVARKPLIGTVAANVLAHGTGALNVDGCRIGTEGGTAGATAGPSTGIFGDGLNGEFSKPVPGLGRWPANVILDESQAQALDRMSGVTSSGSRKAGDYGLMGYMGADVAPMPEVSGDSGGASRFFYTAKADSNERPRVDGVAHPTVKPLDLMRYLVRLVTPPGGLVLEPFAGSGTTLEACIVEGFRCIGIEREDTYMPLIMARISKPIEPVMF